MRPDDRDLDEEIRGHLAINIKERSVAFRLSGSAGWFSRFCRVQCANGFRTAYVGPQGGADMTPHLLVQDLRYGIRTLSRSP